MLSSASVSLKCVLNSGRMTEGSFQPVLDDPVTLDTKAVRTVVLCSGKVFYEIALAREERADLGVAALRLEELYPLPRAELAAAIAKYPDATDIVWAQEEPINMGAWWYLSQELPSVLEGRSLRYAGGLTAREQRTGKHYRLCAVRNHEPLVSRLRARELQQHSCWCCAATLLPHFA